jgi:N6-L-threonylcarbamoyladenine synthase
MLILGIESSCDDTSVAVVRDGRSILSNVVSSQNPIHRCFGGVVPELAARAHLENIVPVTETALRSAEVSWNDLDAVACTVRPGLIGSLVVGLAAAKAIAFSLDLPLVGIDHIEAHAYANCFGELAYETPRLELVVSGGHTLLVENLGPRGSRILGGTVDDAAGEAFDKVAKLLGLGFPGGPAIQRTAEGGDPSAIPFPRPMLRSGDLRLSFSGLKTAVRYYRDRHPDAPVADIAASFQAAVVDVLASKTRQALLDTGLKTLGISGGVAANRPLRQRLAQLCEELGATFHAPPLSLCTDNAAIVAGLAYHKLRQGRSDDLSLAAMASGAPGLLVAATGPAVSTNKA